MLPRCYLRVPPTSLRPDHRVRAPSTFCASPLCLTSLPCSTPLHLFTDLTSPNLNRYMHKLDCLVRQLGFEFAQNKTQTNLRSIYTALDLSNCTNFLSDEQLAANDRALVREPARYQSPNPPPMLTVYVSTNGSDTNPGTAARPFATLRRARDEIRSKRGGRGMPSAQVSIRAGKYYLRETLELDARDSHVRFTAAGGEGKVVLSGGFPLRNSTWQPSSRPGVFMTTVQLPPSQALLPRRRASTRCSLTR